MIKTYFNVKIKVQIFCGVLILSEKLRILHTADLHLGAEFSGLGGIGATRKAELNMTSDNIFKICRGNKIDLLLIAGDIFENNSVEEATVAAFFSACEKTPDTRIFIAAGNHDPLTLDSPYLKYNLPQNVTILGDKDECITLEERKVRIYGKSFSSVYMAGADRFSIVPEDDDFINIMVLHGDISSDKSGVYNPISIDFLESSKMDYVALGHVHEFSGIKKAGGTYYAYPGTPEPHGFDETGPKGVICGDIGKNYCNLTFVETAKRTYRHEQIDIGAAKNNSDVAEIITSNLKNKYGDKYTDNLYKIDLVGKAEEALKINCAEITSRLLEDIFFAKVKDKTEIAVDLELLAKENTLRGKFVKYMLQKAAEEPQNTERIHRATALGLKAFNTEVKFSENR